MRQKMLGTPCEMAPAKARCSMGDTWYLTVPRITAKLPNSLLNSFKLGRILIGYNDKKRRQWDTWMKAKAQSMHYEFYCKILMEHFRDCSFFNAYAFQVLGVKNRGLKCVLRYYLKRCTKPRGNSNLKVCPRMKSLGKEWERARHRNGEYLLWC